MLIVPAELKLSAELISGCLCVNPGKLVQNAIGGCYANIYIGSINLPRSDDGKLISNDAERRIRVDIQNI